MPCSAITLSLATITAIVSVAMLAIAFSTDNWLFYEVKRSSILKYASEKGEQGALVNSMNTQYYYYTRTKGLFRICYPKERPPTVETYLSPVETHCMNIDYFIPDTDNVTKNFSEEAMTRLHMGRAAIALFIVSFFVVFIAFWTGVAGCWRRSPANITSTAILMLLASLLSAGAMGLWHGEEYFEKEKVVGEEYYQQWSNILQEQTKVSYDWSMVLAWLSVGFSFMSSVLLFGATCCLRSERQAEQDKSIQYMMQVYPQKQQPYAYGYAYPGPYYHGAAYGPYAQY
ncbi:transmembrane protein 235 isoform X2 [Cloeon dipterum]|uniref:Voltage-dependent calcium channel gamma-5 subunit n=2 Tax=Cloeon dipterum TaxID=197152 RepID=A0A8S1CTJ8_9INSE|nr:Hypothetical predicted protein [Cloeon dipterum]